MSTTLTSEEIKQFKGRGWLHNKGTDAFSARIITVNGKVSADQLQAVADAARTYGCGEVTFTSRQTMEVPGVPTANIPAFEAAITAAGMSIGGTGPRVRPITACKGTVCPRGLIDTFSLSRKIHERFYLAWHGVTLPGKFKIGVGGCPNNCIKPNLNDLGVTGVVLQDGTRGFQITLGGHWGRTGGAGTPVPTVLKDEESVLGFIERTLVFYRDHGEPGERFFKTLARIGFDAALGMIG
jgi:dissimilatory sulfite reductase (desulfoviridin) alpha/beta subunit